MRASSIGIVAVAFAVFAAPSTSTADDFRDRRVVRAFLKLQKQPGWDIDRNPPNMEVDHIVPLADGGADHVSNLQFLTIEDHNEKTVREATQRRQGLTLHSCGSAKACSAAIREGVYRGRLTQSGARTGPNGELRLEIRTKAGCCLLYTSDAADE